MHFGGCSDQSVVNCSAPAHPSKQILSLWYVFVPPSLGLERVQWDIWGYMDAQIFIMPFCKNLYPC